MNTFEDLLARDGRLVYKTKGVSMEPLLRQNRDLVIIQVPVSRLKKYDVALYRRGPNYVLHRVIEVKEGFYLIRGDNTYVTETVPDSNVIGVLSGFLRKKKKYSVADPGYRCYVRIWCAIYPVRLVFYRLYRLVVRVIRKLGLLPLAKRVLRKR